MTEIQYLYEKYKNRDIIEIEDQLMFKILNWSLGKKGVKLQGDYKDLLTGIRKILKGHVIKFIDKGVIIIKPVITKAEDFMVQVYPFEFTDNNTCRHSIYLRNSEPTGPETILALACKIESSAEITFRDIGGRWNDEVVRGFLKEEVSLWLSGEYTGITPIMREYKERGELVGDWQSDKNLGHRIAMDYIGRIVETQVATCLAINAYFALLDKHNLVTRIEQKLIPKASGRTEAKRSKRSLFYRYVAQVSPDYLPRHFDLTYLVSQWQRAGHKAIRWVRKENAPLLAERAGGIVTDRVRGDYIAIEIPIKPQTCHRSPELIKSPDLNEGHKLYKP